MKEKIKAFIKEWRLEWALFTVFVYFIAIPFTIIVFPDNNMWLGLLVVFGGLTAALNDLADRIDDK